MAADSPNGFDFGDCLDVKRDDIPDDSVDLIYLDPPRPSLVVTSGFRATGQSSLEYVHDVRVPIGTSRSAQSWAKAND